ncbi:DUF1294 domain-containing protein [Ferribacterium limneticum]|uniref:DUF1294 domain-containing protein n=1 Tax=Ferribacterium limneticum TaxID=76259 RepID=UPI001CFAD7FA|nr:DUF1294 domain-containing protein [Ferribacterium limneticum]UCV29214.1 cold shock and DUF1294 domain-containing protein [Ferribacterium limneticum]UCV33133.1 cold shock and DUF1294 domain-containing protein [Ferribacterium limneticum]
MRFQGRITNWKDDQGYGFITPNGGGEPVFLHIKAFARRQPRPVGEEIVTYELQQDNRGRLRASAVEFVRSTGRQRVVADAGLGRWPLVLAGLFFAFLGAATVAGKMHPLLLAFYAAISITAFIAYALDKSAARDGRWRTAENTLHLLALLGGWPGALLAQYRLRHKSSKPSFLIIFWATVLLNCGALGLLLTPTGGRVLRTALGAS